MYRCNQCRTVLHDKSSFSRHINTQHGGMKGLQCCLCLKLYSRKDVLVRHFSRVHNIVVKNQKQAFKLAKVKSSDPENVVKNRRKAVKVAKVNSPDPVPDRVSTPVLLQAKNLSILVELNPEKEDEVNTQDDNNLVNDEETNNALESPPSETVSEISNEISSSVSSEDESGKILEKNQMDVEGSRKTSENLPLIIETSDEVNNKKDELDEALDILKNVHSTILTSSVLDSSLIDDTDFLNIKNNLLSM